MESKKPEFIKDDEQLNKYLEYLDDLRDSGVTNMFGGGLYLQKEFHISRNEAQAILRYWMDTFSERHPIL